MTAEVMKEKGREESNITGHLRRESNSDSGKKKIGATSDGEMKIPRTNRVYCLHTCLMTNVEENPLG